jgi:hypothetical protein
MVTALVTGIRGFFRFWYGFIIGDDWTVAASVAVAMVGTWALLRAGVNAWWLLPAVAVLATAMSLRRAERRAERRG